VRFYVFTPGPPGYISAEVTIRDLMGEDEARGWADEWKPGSGSHELISRAEALMVPASRDALERWERRDDSILQDTEVAQTRADHRAEAESEAELGCSMAAAALDADDPEAIRVAINEHGHNDCGWQFPDDPKPRRLRSVG